MARKSKTTPEMREKMMKLWKETGLSYRIIAERFGVHANTVKNVIHSMNTSSEPTKTKRTQKQIIDEQRAETAKEIAKLRRKELR